MKNKKFCYIPKHELIKTIKNIRNKDYCDLEVNNIIKWCDSCLILKQLNGTNQLILYRCSKFNDGDRDIKNIKSFSYPDNPKIGRCNISGKPVLYLSFDTNTPFFEINTKINDIIYISEWIFNPVTEIYEIPFFLCDDIQKNNSYAANYKNFIINSGGMKKINKMSKIDKNKYKYLLKSISDLMVLKSDDYYDLTSKICDKMFSGYDIINVGNINVGIISYPSISTELESINFAFNTKLVDNGSIKLNKIKKVLVTNISDINVDYQLIAEAIVINNNIIWSN